MCPSKKITEGHGGAPLSDTNVQFQDGRRSWKLLYEAALREQDPNLLSQRIADAQKAIGECTLALLQANIDNKLEKENLANAHLVLENLKRLYASAEAAA